MQNIFDNKNFLSNFQPLYKIPSFQTKPDADPALYINPEQPLIATTTISNDDIDKQEARVLEMRKKLSEAIESLCG